jgi:hypothetical protein
MCECRYFYLFDKDHFPVYIEVGAEYYMFEYTLPHKIPKINRQTLKFSVGSLILVLPSLPVVLALQPFFL